MDGAGRVESGTETENNAGAIVVEQLSRRQSRAVAEMQEVLFQGWNR